MSVAWRACYVTLNKLNELNLHIVFYSDLLLYPKRELEKILELYSMVEVKEKIKRISSQYLLSSCLKKNIPIGEINSIKKAKFSLQGLPGLLGKYAIDVEM